MKCKITIIVLLICVTSFSQQIITDRPDQTESSSTIAKESLQIEMGIVVLSSDNKSVNAFAGPSTLLRYGISENLELRIFNQYESIKVDMDGSDEKDSGFSDLELGFKVQLFKKEDVNTEVAFLSHAIIPTASKAFSNEKWGTINKLSISHALGKNIGLGYNVGYDYIFQTHRFTYSAALGFSFSEKFGGYIEPYGFYAEGGLFQSFFDAGLTYLMRDNFQLDISYGLGMNNDMQYFSAGFSWNIPHLFGSKNKTNI